MVKAPQPPYEEERLKTLHGYEILDTLQEKHFDEITRTAATICDCKIALISLIDDKRQWFKSRYGLEVAETAREISYCGHAIMGDELFIVEDASKDDRFCDNPLLLNDPHIRFYAGAPLVAPNGHKLGTLCVIDSIPKVLSLNQKEMLQTLSKQVVNYFEIRRITEQLKNSELKRAKVIDNILEGMVVQDETGKIIEFNSAALEVLDLTEGQLLGRDSMDPRWRAIKLDGQPFPGEEHPAMQTIRTRESVKGVIMGIETSGRGQRWIQISSVPLAIKERFNVVTTFQDITDQINFQNELRRTNQYLDLALEGAGLGIWEWDLRNNSVKYDRRWAGQLGLELAEIDMTFSTWEERVHPDDLTQCLADIKLYIDGKTDRYENIHRLRHKDGHWVYVLNCSRFSEWDQQGKPTKLTGTHFDITRAKEQERELALILQGNSIGIWKFNPICNALTWDESMFKIYGIEKESFTGDYQAWVKCLHPDSKLAVMAQFEQALKVDSHFDTMFSIVTNRGERRFIQSRAVIERDKCGIPTMVIGVNTDVTKEQEALREVNRQMKISLHNAKLASIGELATGVAHEVNNPLTITSGFINILKDLSLSGPLVSSEQLLKYVNKIENTLGRIEKIVKGLGAFARADLSEVTNFTPLVAVDEAFQLTREIFEREGIQLQLVNDLQKDNVLINGHRERFQQVILNLLSNARDAVSKNDCKKIQISVSDSSDQFILKVEDNGCGIPSEILDKIFDPFFTTKELHRGIGIGLSLVQNFVKDMNGIVEVFGHQNQGTCFVVKIPVI